MDMVYADIGGGQIYNNLNYAPHAQIGIMAPIHARPICAAWAMKPNESHANAQAADF
jgi:hypothetical protein